MRSITFVAAFVVLASAWPPAAARQVENWTYERLFKEADLVVIATATGTAATDDRASDERYRPALVGQRTTFEVHSALKGTPAGKSLAVVHFKYADGKVAQNGALLVSFRTEGPVIEGNGRVKFVARLSTPQYLLFLKGTGKDRYEPVSGQIDPALSVKEIYAPLPAEIGGR